MAGKWKIVRRCICALAVLLLAASIAEGQGEEQRKPEIIRVDELKPGMKGYGLTVFKGTEIEKFDVEVIDVLKNFFPKMDIILIRCSHPVIEHANIIGGMSGSPIYIEGRLAGALAYGFVRFAKDPIAGVTPIENMLAELDRPVEQTSVPHRREFREDDFLRRCTVPVIASGITRATLRKFEDEFKKLGLEVFSGGGAGRYKDLDIKLEPGAAVGVELLRGDFSFEGIGTVTYCDGDKLLAFGHELLGGGQICMPMTTAYVNQVMASQVYSYKMASVVKPVGTFTQDRMACAGGTIGQTCPMVPLTITITNKATGYETKYKLEMIQQEQITPLLLRVALSNALHAAEPGDFTNRTLFYELKLHLKDIGTLVLDDMVEGDYLDMAVLPALMLLNNPFKKVQIESVEANVAARAKQLVASIESATLDATEVKPGTTLTVSVVLRPFDLPTVKRTLSVKVPSNIPPGNYEIVVASGPASFEVPPPDSIEDIIQALRERFKSNELVATFPVPSVGITYKGKKMPNLPMSVFGALLSAEATGISVQQDKLQVRMPTEWIIRGRKTVAFRVKE